MRRKRNGEKFQTAYTCFCASVLFGLFFFLSVVCVCVCVRDKGSLVACAMRKKELNRVEGDDYQFPSILFFSAIVSCLYSNCETGDIGREHCWLIFSLMRNSLGRLP